MQPNSPQTAKGHEEPFGTQFSVFLPNRVGALRNLLDLFADRDVAIYGLSITDSSEWSVVRAVCSEPNKARELLALHGAGFVEKEVLLVELPDEAALAEMCSLLLRAELNILFAYPLLIRSRQNPVLVVDVDDHSLAVQLLVRHGYAVVGAEDLADPT